LKCDQQVGAPLFQWSHIPTQQDLEQMLEETNGGRASHQNQPARKSTGENNRPSSLGVVETFA